MALTSEILTRYGITLPAGYVRIDSVVLELPIASDPFVVVRYSVYASEDARKAGTDPIPGAGGQVTASAAAIDQAGLCTAAYAALKTLRYPGAKDVVDTQSGEQQGRT